MATPATGDLRSSARQLTMAQEGYYAAHGTYTTDIAALGLLKPGSADVPKEQGEPVCDR